MFFNHYAVVVIFLKGTLMKLSAFLFTFFASSHFILSCEMKKFDLVVELPSDFSSLPSSSSADTISQRKQATNLRMLHIETNFMFQVRYKNSLNLCFLNNSYCMHLFVLCTCYKNIWPDFGVIYCLSLWCIFFRVVRQLCTTLSNSGFFLDLKYYDIINY